MDKIIKKILTIILCLCFTTSVYANASSELTFHISRYEGQVGSEDGTGTTCWWSVIPNKYKPHVGLAYPTDPVSTVSNSPRNVITPTTNAKRNGAILAVNMGLWNGIVISDGHILWEQDKTANETLYMTSDGILNTVPNKKYNTTESILDLHPVFAVNGFVTIGKDNVNYYLDKKDDVSKRAPRTFMGQDSVTLDYFVGVCSGRKGDGERNEAGLTYYEIYDFVEKNITPNIKILYNGDGGGSSAFVWNGQKLNYNTDGAPYLNVCDEGDPGFDPIYNSYKNRCVELNNNKQCKNLSLHILENNGLYCTYERLVPYIVYWKDDPFYLTPVENELTFDNSNYIISRAEIGKTIKDIKELLYTNGTYEISDKHGNKIDDNATIKSGNKMVISDLNNNILNYSFAVRGDVEGNGSISKKGAKIIAKHIIDNNVLSNEYLTAADYNLDGQVKMNDVMRILKEV